MASRAQRPTSVPLTLAISVRVQPGWTFGEIARCLSRVAGELGRVHIEPIAGAILPVVDDHGAKVGSARLSGPRPAAGPRARRRSR